MAIPMLTTATTVNCPHGGQVTLFTSNTRAKVDGAPILLLTDIHTVVGCPFTVGPTPRPCVTVRWLVGASQTRIDGIPVLLWSSIGNCLSAEQIPQGPPIIVSTQHKAEAI